MPMGSWSSGTKFFHMLKPTARFIKLTLARASAPARWLPLIIMAFISLTAAWYFGSFISSWCFCAFSDASSEGFSRASRTARATTPIEAHHGRPV